MIINRSLLSKTGSVNKEISNLKKTTNKQKNNTNLFHLHFFHKVLVCNISSAIIYAASISLQSFFCIISCLKQRFARHKDQWVANAKRAWQGAINAQSLNIEKVPAITFDKGKTLIYGVTNLLEALKIYKREVK
jgi:uncharacterized protein YjiK